MGENTNSKTIAKNTIFLYFRMMFTMLVSLYTSRVILQVLGIDDFGLYQAVGGIVLLLSFVNGALSTGSSRFLTFELGTGNFKKLKDTFSSVLTVHIILAFIIVLIAETVGLWFVYNKLVIPLDRLEASVIVYHLSIITAIITITQVPYNASIISHERMNIYAYMSIIEVLLKLGIVYLLKVGSFDKLVLYAILLCLVQIGIALFYRFYCVKHFLETRYEFLWDSRIIKNVLGYSGWNLIANTAHALNNQGATILINMFFSPAIVSARAIANQVNMAANQFISNFRTASNPQIVKRYAAGDYDGSKKLLLISTMLSFYLMYVLCLPICLVSKELLSVWLVDVPEYTVEFLQLTIITSIFQVFDTSFYTALYAKGRIKENALICPTTGLLVFPIVYIMFKAGLTPICLAWALMIHYALNGIIIKPLLIHKIVDYGWKEIWMVFFSCSKVCVLSLPIPLITSGYIHSTLGYSFTSLLLISVISIISVSVSVWLVGLTPKMKNLIINYLFKKIGNK